MHIFLTSAKVKRTAGRAGDSIRTLRALKIGRCGESQVHRARDEEGRCLVIVGHDDETRAFGIMPDRVNMLSVLEMNASSVLPSLPH
jgi:hypothetical protein